MFFQKKQTYNLTPIQELLLALLRAQLWLKPVDDIKLPTTLDDWNALMDLAYKQTVVCFVSAACLRHKDVDNVPEEIREEMQAVIEENKKIHEHHNEVLVELIIFFEGHGLHPVLLKGQGLAQMYPQPELRQCGDIDLYFQPDEYEKAKEFIVSIEDRFEKRHKEDYKHYESQYKGITVEIHRRVVKIPNPFANKRFLEYTDESMKHLLKYEIAGCMINIFGALYNITYVFIHMWNHFEGFGVSLRQLCDVVMIRRYFQDNVSDEEIQSVLSKMSFSLPWRICRCCFIDQLGLDICENSVEVSEYGVEVTKMLSIILSDGAFNSGKHKREYEMMPKWKRRLFVHINAHNEFMKVYPVTGNRIFWRYAAFKRNIIYRGLVYLSNFFS